MLKIEHLTMSQADKILIDDLSVAIAAGHILTIMGHSGSGKSTLLNWLIGLDNPEFVIQGNISLNHQDITQLPTQQRQMGILFQDDLLFPHLSVGENLAFALPAHIKGKALRKQRINQALEHAELGGFHDRDPATLSGGQRARISLLRTLLAEPKALLLDEPFSKLDSNLRNHFRQFVYEQIKQQNIPTILVTHDKDDAPKQSQIIVL